ncbi:glutamate-rich protein 1 isoform X5 [Salarias fasciatus]|uniref:Glutamate-rich 1 n=1 Tax=Salarias fasciatus TaxID=181472 RepID=A0A672IIK7_SALFA|nr:glutamate-rich protein 1 isoform X5 [Salarias fasciatus]
MAQRKEVFQSKVLQKLYPPPKPVKTRSPPHSESLAKKSHVVKRKTPGEDALHGRDPSAANQGRRMYTALPPPPDYHIQSQESVTLPQLHGVNTAEDPAEEKVQEHSEDSDEETEEEEEPRKRRRRKKKRRPSPGPDCGKDGEASGSRAPADEGGEPMSRNKKRKLKKKRHKEKLLSMGLIPRAAAVEFTYQRDEEETEDEERKAAEVSEFLRTTMETYVSDSSLHAAGVPQLSATVDKLVERLSCGGRPGCVLRQLHNLKALAQRCEADRLEKALEELSSTSVLSAEETAAVVSLFQYWITDIVPMLRDENTKLSTTHP